VSSAGQKSSITSLRGTNCKLYRGTVLLVYVLHVIWRRYGTCDL
jgi:hypothetical protein